MLQKELSRIDDKLKRIKEAYKNGVDSLEEYKEGKELLDVERKSLEEKLNALQIKVNDEQEDVYKRQSLLRSLRLK